MDKFLDCKEIGLGLFLEVRFFPRVNSNEIGPLSVISKKMLDNMDLERVK